MTQQDVSKIEAEYFDRFIAEQGEFNPFTERGWLTLTRRFSQWLDIPEPVNLLDVGCGSGNSRRIYIDHCRSYTGIDLSSQMIEVARRHFPESQWEVANATQLPFPDNSFDVVAFSGLLHHLPDYLEGLREGIRVLRPGGLAFAYDPNRLHPGMALFRWSLSPLYNPNGVSPNERPLLPGKLREAFGKANFVNIRQRCTGDIPYRYVAPRLMKAFLTVYNAGDWLMARLGIDRVLGTLVLTCGHKSLESK